MKTFDPIEIFQALGNCKNGTCCDCRRCDKKSSNNYNCRKQLLQDCYDYLDRLFEIEAI